MLQNTEPIASSPLQFSVTLALGLPSENKQVLPSAHVAECSSRKRAVPLQCSQRLRRKQESESIAYSGVALLASWFSNRYFLCNQTSPHRTKPPASTTAGTDGLT